MAALKGLLPKRAPTFEAFEGASGKWFVRRRAANGEIQDLSEAYGGPKSRDNGRQGARTAAMRKAAQTPGAKWKVIPLPVLTDTDG